MSWEFVFFRHVSRLNNHHLTGNTDSDIIIQYRGLTVQFKVYVLVPCNVKSTRSDLTPVCTQLYPAIRHDVWGLD